MAKVSGGTKLKEALQKITKKVDKGAVLKVGFLSAARYPNGTSVAFVAAANNFGTDRAPPRPFFSDWIRDKNKGWAPALGIQLKDTNYNVELAMDRVGQGMEDQLKEAIRDFQGIPLAQSTIDRKGFDKQLIHTRLMLNSAKHEVKK